MSDVTSIEDIRQIKSEKIQNELVTRFFEEETIPKITGDKVYRIEFTSKEDWDYVTKIEEVDRNIALEGAGTTMIGSVKQSSIFGM